MTLPQPELVHVLDHTRCWGELRGKRIFITGASGFVGNWLVESFAFANRRLSLCAELVPLPRDTFPPGHFHFGIHLAKAPTFWADLELTRRALDFASGRGATRFLFTSSGAIYGPQPSNCAQIPETYSRPLPADPGTAYAQAKRAGEILCAEYASRFGFAAVIARLFSFTGPGLPLHANFAIGNFLRDVLLGGPIQVQGDGKAVRSYLHPADLAVWLWTLLVEGRSAHPYNVGSDQAVSIAQLAAAVAAHTIPSTPIVISNGSPPGAARYVPSIDRVFTELRLRPLIALDQAIRCMYAGESAPLAATSLKADTR